MNASWKEIALEKQLKFKTQVLKLTESGTLGKKNKSLAQILHDTDAQKGANFYCHDNPEAWQALRKWSREDKGERLNFLDTDYKNMVSSKAIAFNLFYPLVELKDQAPELLNSFLEALFDKQISVDKVLRIKIDFASALKPSALLDDQTTFDIYVEYLDEDRKCGLGVVLKYAEKASPYTKVEKKKMWDHTSIYNQLSKDSQYYNFRKLNELRGDQIKTLWLNHLLGLKLVSLDELDNFYSVLMYPEGNTFQEKAAKDYKQCIIDEEKESFMPITFEKFITVADELLISPEQKEWIAYLKERY